MTEKKNTPTPPAPKPADKSGKIDFAERPARDNVRNSDGVILTQRPPSKPKEK